MAEPTDKQPEENKNLGGRPSIYSEELVVRILTKMASGESLRHICKADDMPNISTVMLWAAENREGFSARYESAYTARALYWADELLDIADDSTNDYMDKAGEDGETKPALNSENIQRSRLRVDSRKWLLSKLIPKFADKQQLDHSSSDGSMTPSIDASKLSTGTLKEILAARDTDKQ